jgi:hypothetical protein
MEKTETVDVNTLEASAFWLIADQLTAIHSSRLSPRLGQGHPCGVQALFATA